MNWARRHLSMLAEPQSLSVNYIMSILIKHYLFNVAESDSVPPEVVYDPLSR